MKQKMELVTIGYGFTFLNIYATSIDYSIIGIGFGVVSAIFFIKALRIK